MSTGARRGTAADRRPTALLVDDDQSLRTVLSRELDRMGFQVVALPDGSGVPDALSRHAVDAVLLDMNLPGDGGMAVLQRILQQDPDQQVVVFTGHGSVEVAVQAMRLGACDFLTKPVGLEVLEQTLRHAVGAAELVRENRRLRRLTQGPRGTELELPSPRSRQLAADLERIGRSDQSVLILGESGVGKELAARRLHACSPRAERPFVVLNCGAVPRHLIESELFGHLKGAFTGAEGKRLGLFEAASGGTLLLDEVGELPLEVQPTLLRALQFGEVRPVGSDTVRTVDVRVLAATHRDLRQMIAGNRFREDLYYRLAVLEVRVAPLRERPEDTAVLAETLLRRESARVGRPLRLLPAALGRLQQHDWPGNVRELENAMVRLAVLADGPDIDAPELARIVFGAGPERAPGPLPSLRIAELEQLAIDAAMRRHGGNKRLAAEALGVSLKTLYNKLNARDDADA